jgi:hypothetical protein
MPLEVWNIQQERIGGLHVNPPDDPHDWFTVGLYGTDTGEPALGFQLHDTTERPPDGVTPEGRGDGHLLLDGAARVRTPARSAWPKRQPQVFLNAATPHRRPAAHPVLAEFGRLARRWPTIRSWSSPSTWRTRAHHAQAECVRLATLAWVTRSRARGLGADAQAYGH